MIEQHYKFRNQRLSTADYAELMYVLKFMTPNYVIVGLQWIRRNVEAANSICRVGTEELRKLVPTGDGSTRPMSNEWFKACMILADYTVIDARQDNWKFRIKPRVHVLKAGDSWPEGVIKQRKNTFVSWTPKALLEKQ